MAHASRTRSEDFEDYRQADLFQRYTEAGGTHYDSENLAMVTGNPEVIQANLFSAENLEKLESLFMEEKPPRDGHRVAILKPEHNKMGVGLSHSVNPTGDSRVALSEEFVDEYGEYSKIPNIITRGVPFEISGTLFPGVKLYGTEVYWEAEPTPMTKAELDETYCYTWPDTLISQDNSENLLKTMKVLENKNRQHFSARITPDKSWKSGLYYVLIWGTRPGDKSPIVVSTRTTHLD